MKTVYGRGPHAVRAALKIIESRKYPLEKLATHHFPVEQTGLALLTAARNEKTDVDPIHVSIVPTA